MNVWWHWVLVTACSLVFVGGLFALVYLTHPKCMICGKPATKYIRQTQDGIETYSGYYCYDHNENSSGEGV